ncbi:MAG: hypothetical protein WBX27_06285, partial [Specibacter sp.]
MKDNESVEHPIPASPTPPTTLPLRPVHATAVGLSAIAELAGAAPLRGDAVDVTGVSLDSRSVA